MTFNNTTLSNELYPISNGTTSSSPFVVQFQSRDPTTSDIQYPIQKLWLNTSTDQFWFLKNFISNSGITLANWIPFSGFATVETVTGDDGVIVNPLANNLNFIGNAVTNATHAKPIFFRSGGSPNEELDVQVSAAAGASNINNAGISSFLNTQFTVDANGFTSITGGALPIQKVNIDASSAPGTDPVLADATGTITVTGAQVAAGTTTSVIRTDSLAANTYAIEIQRSQAVATSTVGVNGVSHFHSTQFQVDGNAFVQFPSIGSYLPTIFGSTSAGTATYEIQSGRYQILGNWIAVNVNLKWTGHTGTGDMMVGNFPVIFAGAQSFYPSACMLQDIPFPALTSWVAVTGINATFTANVTASITNAALSNVQMSANGTLMITLLYPYV